MRPTSRCLYVFAAGLPVAALPAIAGGQLWPAWLFFLAIAMMLLVAELALLPSARAVAIDVAAPPVVYFGDDVTIAVTATASRRVAVDVRLECQGAVEPLPAIRLDVSPAGPATVEVPLLPERRGVVALLRCHARWTGPLGLLWCEVVSPLPHRIAVASNVRAVRQRALRMVSNREFQVGLKVERFIGDGSEFESLREYVAGMDRRAIDWKATARHREVLCREFRAERDHAVMLCVDAGRLMGEPLAGMPRLDHAIHLALQLGYVCLRTGDRVGVFTFAAKPQTTVLPQSGVHTLQAIQDRLVALDYAAEETNFTLAMTELLRQLRRRTLVVLFTDFADSITAELMLRNVSWLARKHLLLFVSMRDPMPERLARSEPHGIEDLHRAVIAAEIQRERALVLQRIRTAGAQVLDAEVAELERGLIARYLQLKRREAL
ncbi:MAG TPA: DUF58 domain-containing protein [Planctomycetota bacterium]|nr:DUF58 domain-containing protein [Planctomycetota bacterium]